jgi:hypothetical protein
VYLAELETPSEHLRNEAKEMILKMDIQKELQAEMEKRQDKKEPFEMVN